MTDGMHSPRVVPCGFQNQTLGLVVLKPNRPADSSAPPCPVPSFQRYLASCSCEAKANTQRTLSRLFFQFKPRLGETKYQVLSTFACYLTLSSHHARGSHHYPHFTDAETGAQPGWRHYQGPTGSRKQKQTLAWSLLPQTVFIPLCQSSLTRQKALAPSSPVASGPQPMRGACLPRGVSPSASSQARVFRQAPPYSQFLSHTCFSLGPRLRVQTQPGLLLPRARGQGGFCKVPGLYSRLWLLYAGQLHLARGGHECSEHLMQPQRLGWGWMKPRVTLTI